MITIIPAGRLGNNLFQFAFGLTASKKLKTSFVFNTSEIEKHFELHNYNSFFIKLNRSIRYLFSLKFNTWHTLDLNINTQPAEILTMVHNHTVFFGYFQSEQYFKNEAESIRKHFKIKENYLTDFRKKYHQLFNKQTVCVAIRLTDYKTWKINEIDNNTPELSFDYFKKAIDLIDNIESKSLFFISDDLEEVKKNMNYKNASYIAGEIDSLIALTLADELIISNSSFHWWGAWLNSKPGKTVYAPKFWLGHKVGREYPINIIPQDWIKVEV